MRSPFARRNRATWGLIIFIAVVLIDTTMIYFIVRRSKNQTAVSRKSLQSTTVAALSSMISFSSMQCNRLPALAKLMLTTPQSDRIRRLL